MGFKKMLKYQMAKSVFKKVTSERGLTNGFTGGSSGDLTRSLSSVVKKLVITVVAIGLILFIGAIALLGFAFSKVNNLAQTTDLDLVALEKLISDKTITLTIDQKATLAPLVNELSQKGITPEESSRLKSAFWLAMDPSQVKMIQDWKTKTKDTAGNLANVGKPAIADTISKYVGVAPEKLQSGYDSISAWFQLKCGTENITNNLNKELTAKP